MGETRIGIAGGGPAGLAAAIEAARLGFRVDLYERNRIGDHIRCAEGFVDTMHRLEQPGAGVRFEVNEALVQVEREYLVRCRRVRLWMIDRAEWQRSLADQARAAGAHLWENTRIDSRAWQDLQRDHHWVIDASGAPSLTSLQYGFRDYYRKHSAYTAQYVMEGDFDRFGKRLKFVLFPNYEGYYWIFPKGRDAEGRSTANVGLGLFQRGSVGRWGNTLWERLDRLNAEQGIEGRVLRRHGGIVPIRLLEQLEYGNVLLAGDAAGCASPLHGGGIDTSFATGVLAARWIAGREGRLPDGQLGNRKSRSAGGNSTGNNSTGSYSAAVWDMMRRKHLVEEKICGLWSRLDRPALDAVTSLGSRDIRQMRLWSLLSSSWLLIRHIMPGYRLMTGLTRGRW
jgi:digeranylgeranylglycerophospholipid reductase